MKHRLTKYGFLVICGAGLCAMLITGCAKKSIAFTTGLSKDTIIKIDGKTCSDKEADVYLLNLQREYESLFGNESYNKKIADKNLTEYIKEQALKQMSEIKCLNILAEKNNIKLNDEQKGLVKQAASEYMNNMGDSAAKEFGIEYDTVENIYTQYLMANLYYQKVIDSVDKEISDDQARIITIQYMKFSTKTKDENGAEVEISSDAKNELNAKVLNSLERVGSGEDFEKVALDVSDDENVNKTIGRGEWRQDLEKAAFNLVNEQISDVIESEDGIYIIKCISNYDEQKTLDNKQKIYKDNCDSEINKVYNEYMSAVLTEFNDDVWNKKQLKQDEHIKELPDLFSVYRNYFSIPSVEL